MPQHPVLTFFAAQKSLDISQHYGWEVGGGVRSPRPLVLQLIHS